MFAFATTLKPLASRLLAFGAMLLGLDRPHLYRPEAHYMRGPGPKWREKHGPAGRRLAVQRLSANR